jgi:hypothetical protein
MPTVILGALPGAPDWAARLARIGVDVVSSGAAEDTPETFAAAAAAVPHRPCKARAGDPDALAAAGARIIEAAAAPAGAYALTPDDDVLVPGPGTPDEVAAEVLAAAREGEPAALWVAAGPGLDALAEDEAEQRIHVLVEGTHRARMWLVKEQFDRE